MKRRYILLLSGFYVFILGWLPDPLPFLDEGVVLALFLKTLADVLKDRSAKGRSRGAPKGPIIEID